LSIKILLITRDPDFRLTFLRAMVEMSLPGSIQLACEGDGRAALFRLNELLPDLLIAFDRDVHLSGILHNHHQELY
jgi:hypothetical protein